MLLSHVLPSSNSCSVVNFSDPALTLTLSPFSCNLTPCHTHSHKFLTVCSPLVLGMFFQLLAFSSSFDVCRVRGFSWHVQCLEIGVVPMFPSSEQILRPTTSLVPWLGWVGVQVEGSIVPRPS